MSERLATWQAVGGGTQSGTKTSIPHMGAATGFYSAYRLTSTKCVAGNSIRPPRRPCDRSRRRRGDGGRPERFAGTRAALPVYRPLREQVAPTPARHPVRGPLFPRRAINARTFSPACASARSSARGGESRAPSAPARIARGSILAVHVDLARQVAVGPRRGDASSTQRPRPDTPPQSRSPLQVAASSRCGVHGEAAWLPSRQASGRCARRGVEAWPRATFWASDASVSACITLKVLALSPCQHARSRRRFGTSCLQWGIRKHSTPGSGRPQAPSLGPLSDPLAGAGDLGQAGGCDLPCHTCCA